MWGINVSRHCSSTKSNTNDKKQSISEFSGKPRIEKEIDESYTTR